MAPAGVAACGGAIFCCDEAPDPGLASFLGSPSTPKESPSESLSGTITPKAADEKGRPLALAFGPPAIEDACSTSMASAVFLAVASAVVFRRASAQKGRP